MEVPFSDATVTTALIGMSAKCGCVDKARELVNKIPQKKFVSWNSITTGYALNGFYGKSFYQYYSWGMYEKCEVIDKAPELFERVPERAFISRIAMVAGYTPNGFVEKAFRNTRANAIGRSKARLHNLFPASSLPYIGTCNYFSILTIIIFKYTNIFL